MQSDYVLRGPGDIVKPFPLLRDVDFEGIPQELHSLWRCFMLQSTCAGCMGDYSALDSLRYGAICQGRYHRPSSFQRFDEYAVVPLAFINKTGVTLPKGSICIDTFNEAEEWTMFQSAVEVKFETAADIAKQLGIPQPPVAEIVQATLGNMVDYIQLVENETETTVKPWQPIVFIPLF